MNKNKRIKEKRIATQPLLVDQWSVAVIERKDPPPYPLQIEAIPHQDRIVLDRYCKLVHLESGLSIPGQFTHPEASEILKISRYWDWELDRDRIPKCAGRLRNLLNDICNLSDIGGEANG